MKPLSEHLDEMIDDQGEGSQDVPVKLDYDRNLKANTDFVPFDYSKADLKKFNG